MEHKPAELLEIEPEKLTQEEEERIKALEGLIAEEEGRTEEVLEEQGTAEGGDHCVGFLGAGGQV